MGSNRVWRKIAALSAVLALATTAAAIPPNVRVVDSLACQPPCVPDGQSWNTAFRNVQDALLVMDPPAINELWVAAGTYRPDQGGGKIPGDPNASFVLLNGVGMYAGFLGTAYGGNETLRSQRNPEKNITILSGDIGTPGVTSDNSIHVVTAQGVSNTAVLSGFMVEAGFANATGGGGMLLYNASAYVSRCTFRNNLAGAGAGVFVEAARTSFTPAPVFVNCSFFGNIADVKGGGMYATSAFADLHLELHNCVFSGNTTGSLGGAGLVLTRDIPSSEMLATLINCTFTQNDSASGTGGIDSPDSPCQNGGFELFLRNCILWHNGGTAEQDQIDLDGSFCNPSVTYSCIQGLNQLQGNGNIGTNPLFCDADGVDNVIGTVDDNPHLQDGSPCIDTANDLNVPLDVANVDDDLKVNEPLPWDRDNAGIDDAGPAYPFSHWGRFFNVVSGPAPLDKVDMGAYENQHIAACKWDISSSGGGAPPDGNVGTPDQLKLLSDWGSCPGCGADLFDCNLVVDSADYNDLLAHWGPCPAGGAPGGGGNAPQGGSGLSLEEALLALGFLSVEDYIAWNEQASEEDVYNTALLVAALLGGG